MPEIPHSIIEGIYVLLTLTMGYIGLLIKDKIHENNIEIQKGNTVIEKMLAKIMEKMEGHEVLDNTRFDDHDRRLDRLEQAKDRHR